MTKQNNNNTEQNMSIAILCATLWIIFACYLVSLPVSANDRNLMSDDMKYFSLCNKIEDFE